MGLELPPIKATSKRKSHPEVSIGDTVRIVDSKSAFNLKKGTVVAHNPPGYLVKLDESRLSVSVSWSQIVPYVSEDKDDVPANEVIVNLYRRYMWIKFETLSEVLELLKLTTTVDEVRETLCGYMHKNYNSCVKHPLDVIKMLPREDSIVLNSLVKEHRELRRKNAKKTGM